MRLQILTILLVLSSGCSKEAGSPEPGNTSIVDPSPGRRDTQPPDTGSPIEFDHPIGSGYTGLSADAPGTKGYFIRLPEKPVGPIWESPHENPPLSIARAIQLAIERRKELVDDTEHQIWKLDNASLEPWDADDGYWYWRIDFVLTGRPGTGGSGIPFVFVVAVLMDGTVVDHEEVE